MSTIRTDNVYVSLIPDVLCVTHNLLNYKCRYRRGNVDRRTLFEKEIQQAIRETNSDPHTPSVVFLIDETSVRSKEARSPSNSHCE